MLPLTRLLIFLTLCPFLSGQVKFTRLSDRIRIDVDGKEFTQLIFDEKNNKPYLHPLRSVSGKSVTRRYPMEIVANEDTDHPHHRGVAFTHGDVNGTDFWASEPSQKSPKQGRILLDRVVEASGGAKSGTLITIFKWLDPQGKPVLEERRTTIFYSHPTLRIIDFDIALKAVNGPVHFGDTKEGTFGVRVATGLTEDHGGTMTSSDGRRSEKNIWGTRASWVDDSGIVEGEKLGLAVMDHPSNPRYPTYWHSRSYGLLAANIFGKSEFLNDKTQDGSLTLPASEVLRFRYRIVVHPGDVREAHLDSLYKEFSSITAGKGGE